MTVEAVHKENCIWYGKLGPCSLLWTRCIDSGVLFWSLFLKKFPVCVFLFKSSKCLSTHILCHWSLIPCLYESLCKQTDLLQSPQNKIQDGCKHQQSQSRVLFTYLQITCWGILSASVNSCFAFSAANSSIHPSVCPGGMENPAVKWGIKSRECIKAAHTVCCLKLHSLACISNQHSVLVQFVSMNSYTCSTKIKW